MYEELSNPEMATIEFQVNSVKETLTKLKRNTENTLKNKRDKVKENNKVVDVVELTLHFGEENQQEGLGLNILTPNQMLNRIPISLAQLKAGNNSEKLKNKIRQLLHS